MTVEAEVIELEPGACCHVQTDRSGEISCGPFSAGGVVARGSGDTILAAHRVAHFEIRSSDPKCASFQSSIPRDSLQELSPESESGQRAPRRDLRGEVVSDIPVPAVRTPRVQTTRSTPQVRGLIVVGAARRTAAGRLRRFGGPRSLWWSSTARRAGAQLVDQNNWASRGISGRSWRRTLGQEQNFGARFSRDCRRTGSRAESCGADDATRYRPTRCVATGAST